MLSLCVYSNVYGLNALQMQLKCDRDAFARDAICLEITFDAARVKTSLGGTVFVMEYLPL